MGWKTVYNSESGCAVGDAVKGDGGPTPVAALGWSSDRVVLHILLGGVRFAGLWEVRLVAGGGAVWPVWVLDGGW